MTSRTIDRLWTLFLVLFCALALRQAYVQIIMRDSLAAQPYNPRHTLGAVNRGRILAGDGTVLAATAADGRREYPLGASLAHTVGYVSTRYGTSGLEDAYDGVLTAPDTTGDPFAQIGEIAAAARGKESISRGADVITTIVPRIQHTLYSELSGHERAAGVVLDPRTGAVLAMASVPGFDPNDVASVFPGLLHDPASPLLDRAIDGLYPPGSTFKMFVAAAALDSGTVQMDSTFYDPGTFTIGNFVLHDDEYEATGTQDLTGAFAFSSNVDFAQIALKMGAGTFYGYLNRWLIGDSLDFQLPAARARYPLQSAVFPGELAQMGFGQGALLVSPLQMALIGATIANGGSEPRPYVVRQVSQPGASPSTYGESELANPVSADTAENVKKMMIAVVQRGTGTSAQISGVTVAGKTGTATNPSGAAHSWFVCFAPAESPKVVVAVVVENAGYGAAVAAPIARDVLQSALRD